MFLLMKIFSLCFCLLEHFSIEILSMKIDEQYLKVIAIDICKKKSNIIDKKDLKHVF